MLAQSILFIIIGGLIEPRPSNVNSTMPTDNEIDQINSNQTTPSSNKTNESSQSMDLMEHHEETCLSLMEEYVSPVKGSPRCCRKCEVGTGMLRLCTDSEDTQCRVCQPGKEFAPTPSATAKCLQCRHCLDIHPLARIRNPCTPSTDTECECKDGYYMSVANSTCRACTVCKPGEGVVKACSWNSDTECQGCPTGFWSAKFAESVRCIPCKSCTSEQIQVESCSTVSDTLCCPKFNSNCTQDEALHYASNYPTSPHELSDSANDGFGPTHMLPIYCSIMGMIILTLLLYVFYKLWKQRDSLTNSKLSDGTYSVNSSLSRGKESSTVLINNSNNVVYTARAKQPAVYSNFHSSSVGEVNTNITEAKESYNSSLENTNEREPLIRNTCVYSGDLNRPLDTVPLNILGFIGYQLYQKGWSELVTELSLNTLESELQAKYSTDEQPQSLSPLAKLCIDYKHQNENENLPESYNQKELICIAAVIIALVENNSVSLPSLINALCSIKREDLAHLLQQDSSVSVQVPLLTDGEKFVSTGVFVKDQDV